MKPELKYKDLCHRCKHHFIVMNTDRIKDLLKRMSFNETAEVTGIPKTTLQGNFPMSEKICFRTEPLVPPAIENIDFGLLKNPESSESQREFGRIFGKKGHKQSSNGKGGRVVV